MVTRGTHILVNIRNVILTMLEWSDTDPEANDSVQGLLTEISDSTVPGNNKELRDPLWKYAFATYTEKARTHSSLCTALEAAGRVGGGDRDETILNDESRNHNLLNQHMEK